MSDHGPAVVVTYYSDLRRSSTAELAELPKEPRPSRPKPQRFRLEWQDGSTTFRDLIPGGEEWAWLTIKASDPADALMSVQVDEQKAGRA